MLTILIYISIIRNYILMFFYLWTKKFMAKYVNKLEDFKEKLSQYASFDYDKIKIEEITDPYLIKYLIHNREDIVHSSIRS